MTATAYINGRIPLDGEISCDHAVVVNGGLIEAVVPRGELASGVRKVDLEGSYLLPGFIDTQVNGGGGVLFNDSPQVEGIRTMASAHYRFGTTGLLPTLISDDLAVIQQGLAAVEQAMEQEVPGILGIHIEGPFLAHERRGIHDADKLQRLTYDIIDTLEPLGQGRTLLTLAPEKVPPDMVRKLVDKGFIVCAGHSDAGHEQVKAAVRNGLRGFTHLFNAMSQLGAREPGMVGYALDDRDTWCGIIADNHHVSPLSLRVAYRCKGPDRLMLVSDAMPPVGSDQREFVLLGRTMTVRDGVCMDADGTLAGTALDMASALRNMMNDTGCSLADASVMASASPASFLGFEDSLGTVQAGKQADLVIMDEALQVRATLIRGNRVYSDGSLA